MNTERLQQYKRRLLQEREQQLEFVHDIDAWGLDDTETRAVGELSSYDQHPADAGTETFEREKDLGLKANSRLILEKVDDALERMEHGDYGICEVCGNPIGEERLDAIPYTTYCVECKEVEESAPDRLQRPPEEAVLAVPFARTFTDEDDNVEFDGEDAWQAVARYGTSNSPQDIPDAVNYDDAYVDADEDIGTVEDIESVADVTGTRTTAGDQICPDPVANRSRQPHKASIDMEDEVERDGRD